MNDKEWIENLLRLFGSYKGILLDLGYDPFEIAFMSEERAKREVWG